MERIAWKVRKGKIKRDFAGLLKKSDGLIDTQLALAWEMHDENGDCSVYP